MRNLTSLLFLLTSLVSAQIVLPTNNTQINSTSTSDIVLVFQNLRGQTSPVTILPLLPTAELLPGDQLSGQVGVVIPTNSTSNTSAGLGGFIPLINCDPNSYVGFLTAADVLQSVFTESPVAVILYSQSSQGCNLSNTPNTSPVSYQYLYTLSSQSDSSTLLQRVKMDVSTYVVLERRDTFNNTNSGGSGFSAGSTSPTTAVAMIILYSITGVITALFLIIIVTGAIRAHRHPERYGPRTGMGRPRQSRAKGLARAMLDTIPIIKWGEDEDEKPVDVEMAGGAGPTGGVLEAKKDSDHDGETVQEGEGSNDKENTAASPEPTEAVEEHLGCSICTDDFERGQDVRVLPCHHQFHPTCIDPWLLNVSGTCPLCRIDLRPTTSRSVTAESSPTDPDVTFAPPLNDSTDVHSGRRASRRQSLVWDLLNPRLMRDATPQERIAALRRVREERRSTPSEEVEARRRRRLTTRLHDVFSIRTTRNRSPGASSAGAAAPSPRGGSVEAIPEIPAEYEFGEAADPRIEAVEEHQAESRSTNGSVQNIREERSPSPAPESSSAAAARPSKTS